MDKINSGNYFDTTEDNYGVRWGRSKETGERFQYYNSFHLDGEEFNVKDTVYLQASDGPPYIAEIVKLRERVATREKGMLVHWFFRPCELPDRLSTVDYRENSKEIFMAVGSEYSRAFQNPACTLRKCRVMYTGNDSLNRMPPTEQVAAADYLFHRAFNPLTLRVERLDGSKAICEYLGLGFPGKRLKGGSSSCSGQAVEGKGKGKVSLDRNPRLLSKMVVMGKPPSHSSGRETDHTGKLKIRQKSPSEIPSTQGRVLQCLESGKRRREDNPERIMRKSTDDGSIDDKERNLKLSGKQDVTNLEKRRKIHYSVKGEGKTSHNSVLKGETVKGKLNIQSENVNALSLDRVSKAPDVKKKIEKTYEGLFPHSAPKGIGKKSSVPRDGEEKREADIRGKRPLEESFSSGTVKKRLEDRGMGTRSVEESHLESIPPRPYSYISQRWGASLLEPKRVEDTARNRVKADYIGANRKKTLREEKIVENKDKNVQKQNKHHLSSTSTASKTQHALKATEKGETAIRENLSRYVVKAGRIRGTAEDTSRNPRPKFRDSSEYPKLAFDREEKISDVHRMVGGCDPAHDNGKPLSTEDHYKRFMPSKKIFKFPWDEKKSVEEAITKGRALLLQNLDPCLNSIQAEAILENMLETTCDVRILSPKTIACYKSAEAIAIFKKPEIAENVLRKLMENLLVISDDERPVLASLLTKPKQIMNSFHGFFNLERFGWKTNDSVDQKNAVATSHCAQANTVEYDMGLHWRVLQDRDTLEWQTLEEDHQRELQEVKAKYQKS